MSNRRRLLPALAAAVLLGGCGLGAGATPGGVRLDVTRDFGAQSQLALRSPKVHGQETAMSLLMRNASVSTRYGGGFVESIDGHSGGSEGGQPLDWFYYVNGVEAPKGAADTNVNPGDTIWWDLHDWSQTDNVPAVVGSFPEPFLHGIEGLRLPVRLECAQPEGEACHTTQARLRAAGVTSALALLGPAGEVPDSLRILVGTWPQVHADIAAEGLEQGPRASGVYARLPASGGTIALLDPEGATVRTLTGTAGLIAATRYGEGDPEWLITGTDPAGVELAANALREGDLHDRFALAVAAGGAPSGGSGGPSGGSSGSASGGSSGSASGATLLPLPQPSP
jgi:hypothetical protein